MKQCKIFSALFLLLIALFITAPLNSQDSGTITVQTLPKTVSEFLNIRNQIATTPEGGATIFILAFMTYVENNDLGLQFFTISLDRKNLSPGNIYKGYQPGYSLRYHLQRMRNPRYKYMPFSYIQGTSAQNGYKTNPPYRFRYLRNKYSDKGNDTMRILIYCTGAASPRPITLKKNNRGIWKVVEASTIFVGMVPPKVDVDDDI